ncbi:hypothetical protein [Spiroplasma endosymbiont of Poecilobothrus nobilitatus]|uniref:hypothetical protein n=1 Tax=Spiroplasma endosymbiont of Poecilobothrus nobilitatus TaxID=1209220 RepID=UPI00313BA127
MQLKEKIKELEETLEQADLRNIKEINLLDLKIKVNDIEKVKESEIRPYLQATILTAIRQQLNATITENYFSFNFNDYFNQNQPRTINLAKMVNNYVINIVGYNNAKNSIKLEILFPKAVYKIIDFTSFTKIEIPSPEDRCITSKSNANTTWKNNFATFFNIFRLNNAIFIVRPYINAIFIIYIITYINCIAKCIIFVGVGISS